MKSSTEFQEFYQSSLLSVINELEVFRKDFVKKIYMAIGVAIVVLASMIAYGDTQVNESDLFASFINSVVKGIFGLIGLAGLVGYFFWFRPKKKEFRTKFKEELISRIVKFIDPNLSFDHEGGISRTEFEQSGISGWAGDRYLSEDLVSGKLGQTEIRFSEALAQRERKRKGEDESEGLFKSWETIFRGVIFIADFNKHFKGHTLVLTDRLFADNRIKRAPIVKMDNINFEKAFVVHSSDAVEAHYILTPSLMERMVNLHVKSKNVQFAFFKSVVFISFPIKKNLFESSLFRSLASGKKVRQYFDQMHEFIGIVEELNLNTRIWTKT